MYIFTSVPIAHPTLRCLTTAQTEPHFKVRRVVSSLTLRVTPHLGVSSDRSSDWPRSVTGHVLLAPVFRPSTSAAPQRFSRLTTRPAGSFCVRGLVNNYRCTGAGNHDPLLSWLAYHNFYRHICDVLQETLTFKTLIFHLNEFRDLYLVLCRV